MAQRDTDGPSESADRTGNPDRSPEGRLGTEPSDEPLEAAAVESQRPTSTKPIWVLPLALAASALSLIANLQGIASGDDGVGYTAIADSLLDGRGLGYFLEDPVTVWPPLWPSLMALVAKVTPLDTTGAAIALNALTVFGVVIVGHRLLQRTVRDPHLVAIGTAVMALGPVTMGFGHLLMTDLAFSVVLMAWMLALGAYHRNGDRRWLLCASGLVWVGFGLRYVAVYLLALGGVWLLLDGRRRFPRRVLDAVVFGAAGAVVPLAWMLRNHAVDGTWTGARSPSVRGPVDNAYDVVATLGRWILPGVLNGRGYLWAAVGIIVLAGAVWLGWRVLNAAPGQSDDPDTWWKRLWAWLGRPTGLLAIQGFGYLAYIWYVRSTTALNQLDLRLLNPAYFSLMALALVLVDRTKFLTEDGRSPWHERAVTAANLWAGANVLLGLVAVVAFAAGNDFFAGNYESDVFDEIRANPALDAIPEGCTLYSNLPNALYPAVGSQWSPRRTYLESSATTDDLDRLEGSLAEQPSCLVWIDAEPRYGHLWSLDELERKVDLVPLASSGTVSVYRFAEKG